MILTDNTLVESTKRIVELYNEDFRYYKKFHYVNWWEVNTWDFKECNCASTEYINTYFNQPRFFDKLEMMPWVEFVINDLKEFYNITFVSLGYSPNLKLKSQWIEKKFPDIPYIMVNMKKHKDKSGIDMTDGIFIDDSYNNLITSNATEKICFGDVYSWNEKWDGKRLANWMDIKKYLL